MEARNGQRSVQGHYGRGEIFESVLRALREMGRDPAALTPADLAPVDAFHLRGREATAELARRAALEPGLRLLDVGCGLGGSVRYLASEHAVQATGIDLTPKYIDAARALADLVGLGERVAFRQCSALEIPFDAASFDVVWTEHVQMNVSDKRSFYAEIARLLAPGGRLVFHDVFQGEAAPIHFPVPWAEDPAISFLETPESVQRTLQELGFRILAWEEKSQEALEWVGALVGRLEQSGPLPLGVHLLLGSAAKSMMGNMARNLREGRLRVVQAVVEKP